MATVLDIVTRAYRKAGISALGETLSADMAAEGRDAINAMLTGWKLRGVDTTPTTLALTDTFPLDAEFEEGTTYVLASRLLPDYQVPAGFDADDWFRTIQAAYMTITAATIPTGLSRLPSRYSTGSRIR